MSKASASSGYPAPANASQTSVAARSMYSMATGMMPAAMIAATQLPAASGDLKPIIIGRAASRGRDDFDGRLGDDAELSFGPDDEAQKIVAATIEGRTAES